MVKCEYCGSMITPDMRFCKNCGSPVPAGAFAAESGAWGSRYPDGPDYRLIVIGMGSCRRSEAEDLLEDLLQYTRQESRRILEILPAEVAQNLTREQASYLAQALTEYGMEVSVCDRNAYVNPGFMGRGSVFDSDGNYVRRFAEILMMLTAANRILRPMHWRQPIDPRFIFMPDCPPPHPPVHRRRDHLLLEHLYGIPEPAHRRPDPAPRRDSGMRQGHGGQMPMMESGAMRGGGTPSMGRNTGTRGGTPSMRRNTGTRGGSRAGESQGRGGGPSSMGRGGSRSGNMPHTGGRPQGGPGGGGRGPSRGHGQR